MGKFIAILSAFALSSCAAAPVYASPCDGFAAPIRAIFRCAAPPPPAPLVVKAPTTVRHVARPKPRPAAPAPAPVAVPPAPVAPPHVILPAVVPLDAPAAVAPKPQPERRPVMIQWITNLYHGLSWSALALIVSAAWYIWAHGLPAALAAVKALADRISAFRNQAVADVKGAQTALVDEFNALKGRIEAVEVAVGIAKPAAPAPAAEPAKPAA